MNDDEGLLKIDEEVNITTCSNLMSKEVFADEE